MAWNDGIIRMIGGITEGDLTEAIDDALLAYKAEEEGWISLGNTSSRPEPTSAGRKTIYKRAELYWFTNPLIGQAVNLKTYYTFGRGVQVTHPDDTVNATLMRFWNDPRNKEELTSFQAQMDKDRDVQVYGNVFLAFFPQADGTTQVRSIPAHEITDIITDPDDSKRVLWYKREREIVKYDFKAGALGTTGQQEIKYYQDWRYYLEEKDISGYAVPETDAALPSPTEGQKGEAVIMHLCINRLGNAMFGTSDIYRALDWAKAHKDQLEDWATIVRALSTWSWKRKAKSGADLRSAATRLGGTQTTDPADRPANIASILHQAPGTDWEPISVPRGATTSPEDSRQLKLMVSAATGIFEHYFGDPSTGNLSTSKAMELPMLKMFEARQQMWEEFLKDVCEFVLRVKGDTEPGNIQEAKKKDVYGDSISEQVDDLVIEFPPIILKDVLQDVQALVLGLAATKGQEPLVHPEIAATLFMSMLGVDDIQKRVTDLKKLWGELEAKADKERSENALLPARHEAPEDKLKKTAETLREVVHAFRSGD